MKIALDYDGTYTADPGMWITFLEQVANHTEHDIAIVTYRSATLDVNEELEWLDEQFSVIYTNGVAKQFYCEHFAFWEPDIWIDDTPASIINNSDADREWLKEWRANNAETSS